MDFYGTIAKSYEELYGKEQQDKIALIKRFINLQPDATILDVGCGTGISTSCWNCFAIGIDPSEPLLNIAFKNRSNAKTYYVQGRAESLPFRDSSFDLVVSITALQNFENIDAGIKEIARVAKDKIVLSFMKHSPKRQEIEHRIFKYLVVDALIEHEKDIIFFCRKI